IAVVRTADMMLLPFDPARPRRRLHLLDEAAVMTAILRRRPVTRIVFEHARRERLSDDGSRIDAEHEREGPVHERQPPRSISPEDDVSLRVEQVAVADLVLRNLPADVLQIFEAPFEPLPRRVERARPDERTLREIYG